MAKEKITCLDVSNKKKARNKARTIAKKNKPSVFLVYSANGSGVSERTRYLD